MIHLPIHIFPASVSEKFAALCAFLYLRVLGALDVKSGYQRFV